MRICQILQRPDDAKVIDWFLVFSQGQKYLKGREQIPLAWDSIWANCGKLINKVCWGFRAFVGGLPSSHGLVPPCQFQSGTYTTPGQLASANSCTQGVMVRFKFVQAMILRSLVGNAGAKTLPFLWMWTRIHTWSQEPLTATLQPKKKKKRIQPVSWGVSRATERNQVCFDILKPLDQTSLESKPTTRFLGLYWANKFLLLFKLSCIEIAGKRNPNTVYLDKPHLWLKEPVDSEVG